jgi:hypothetical protein
MRIPDANRGVTVGLIFLEVTGYAMHGLGKLSLKTARSGARVKLRV